MFLWEKVFVFQATKVAICYRHRSALTRRRLRVAPPTGQRSWLAPDTLRIDVERGKAKNSVDLSRFKIGKRERHRLETVFSRLVNESFYRHFVYVSFERMNSFAERKCTWISSTAICCWIYFWMNLIGSTTARCVHLDRKLKFIFRTKLS